VNHRDFERTWHFQVSLGSMFLRVEFPPHLGGAPPRGGAAGGGLWRAFGCASLAEAGECGACAPGAGPAFLSGLAFRGCCLQMGPSGSHRRASGVSSRAPTVADVCGSISCRSGFTGDASCERASASQPRTPRGGEGALCALRLNLLHRMEQDYPLNLSISLSGGKETNRDAPSNGE
jgi:hypothetical protein